MIIGIQEKENLLLRLITRKQLAIQPTVVAVV